MVFKGNCIGAVAIFGSPVDLSRQTTGKMALAVTYRLDSWELREGDGSQTMLYLSRGT